MFQIEISILICFKEIKQEFSRRGKEVNNDREFVLGGFSEFSV